MAKTLLMETTEAINEFRYKTGSHNSENPDRVIALKGMVYIEEMERDTHYQSCINTRVQSVVGKKWRIKPSYDKQTGKISPKNQEIADFVRKQLENVPSFESDIIAMFDHISKGFSLSEINYKEIKTGKWKGKIGLKNIRKKPAKQFSFKFDNLGYFTPFQIDPENKELELDKFVHFINGMDDENPYGESVGSKCAFWIWLKKNGAKFWAVYLERYASPLAKVEIPNNITNGTPEYAKALDVLQAVLKDSGIIVPENFDVSLLEATRQGRAEYEGFLKNCNAEISKATLGSTLATDEGTRGTGTSAQATVHAGVLANYTLFDVIVSAAAINYQLIKRLVDLNFITEEYPQFEWIAFDLGMLTVLAQNIKSLIDAGLKIPVKRLYELIGIDMPELHEEVLEPSKEIISQPTQDMKPKNLDNKAKMTNFSETDNYLNFLQKLAETFANENEEIEKQFRIIFTELYIRFGNYIKSKKKISPAQIAKWIQKEFQKPIAKLLTVGYLQGFEHFNRQIDLSEAVATFSEDEIIYNPIEDLIKNFLAKKVMDKASFTLLEKEMQRKAFTIAGIESEYVLNQIKMSIKDTISSGGDLLNLGKEIDAIMEKAGIGPLQGWHQELVIRNNMFEEYGNAKFELTNDADLEDFPTKTVVTIPDEQRRKAHAQMHGFTRAANDPIWQRLKTPFDHNCRCSEMLNHKSNPMPISDFEPDLTTGFGFIK